jgi:hypothetical protein
VKASAFEGFTEKKSFASTQRRSAYQKSFPLPGCIERKEKKKENTK